MPFHIWAARRTTRRACSSRTLPGTRRLDGSGEPSAVRSGVHLTCRQAAHLCSRKVWWANRNYPARSVGGRLRAEHWGVAKFHCGVLSWRGLAEFRPGFAALESSVWSLCEVGKWKWPLGRCGGWMAVMGRFSLRMRHGSCTKTIVARRAGRVGILGSERSKMWWRVLIHVGVSSPLLTRGRVHLCCACAALHLGRLHIAFPEGPLP